MQKTTPLRHPVLLLALAAALVLAATWWLRPPGSARTVPDPVSMPSTATDARPQPASSPRAATASAADFESEDPYSAKDETARIAEGLEKLERKFQAEPVSPAWAAQQERMIANAFTPAALKEGGAPAPIEHQASCRSKTCRISVTYKTDMDAQVAQVVLLGSIAPSLARTTMGQIPAADGSVQLVLYADAGNGPPKRKPGVDTR